MLQYKIAISEEESALFTLLMNTVRKYLIILNVLI